LHDVFPGALNLVERICDHLYQHLVASPESFNNDWTVKDRAETVGAYHIALAVGDLDLALKRRSLLDPDVPCGSLRQIGCATKITP
jgi:hypothetical protein